MPRMTNYLKRLTVFVVLAVLVVATLGMLEARTNAGGQGAGTTGGNPKGGKGAVKIHAEKGAAGGTDTNIKTARSSNAKNGAASEPAAPPAKGGPKSRASMCRFHVDNSTPYTIDVYTDGDYRGTAAPWDDLYGWVEYGATLYARADFDDGTYLYWRGTANSCPKTWTLVR